MSKLDILIRQAALTGQVPNGLRNATTTVEWKQLQPDQQRFLIQTYTHMIQEQSLDELEATFLRVAHIFHSEIPKVIIGFQRGKMIMRVHPDSKDELIKRLTNKLL